jgi:hypothetical protein
MERSGMKNLLNRGSHSLRGRSFTSFRMTNGAVPLRGRSFTSFRMTIWGSAFKGEILHFVQDDNRSSETERRINTRFSVNS